MATPDALSLLSDQALLALRFQDLPRLGVRLASSPAARCTERLLAELSARKLKLRPHFWLSNEWFAPDGVVGIALPFYLAHPRLMQLERRQMGRVEGGTDAECLRILRHEAGHAIENAFGLRRLAERRRLFGPSSRPYPRRYSPRPFSRRFVRHLDDGYAQSHPDEDFAETFAVWLDPKSAWRRRYAGWPVEEKLRYMDSLMKELAGRRPPKAEAPGLGELSELRGTLGSHYRQRRAHYLPSIPEARAELGRVFNREGGMTAGRFLRTIKVSLRRAVSDSMDVRRFDVDRVVAGLAREANALGLRASPADRRRTALTASLAKTTRDCLYRGHHLVPL